ncbi:MULTISPECIES: hypothetical protein [unclassified Micromonospora]|uniref:hypothetical protein n=1 Tax=unclassified Micromonospora TaxID=2617518 RepID=UPI002FF042A7
MDVTRTAPAHLAAWQRAARELALVAVLFLAYKAGRQVVAGHADVALANGEWVWRLERLLRLPDETVVQGPLLSHELLVRLANSYYAYCTSRPPCSAWSGSGCAARPTTCGCGGPWRR